MTKYFELLIQGLHKTCYLPIDIAKCYNFTTFDISSDLTFGESFECVSTGKMHVSVRTFDIAKVCSVLTVVAVDLDNLWFHQIYGIIGVVARFSPLDKVLWWLMPESKKVLGAYFQRLKNEKVAKRLDWETDRQDLYAILSMTPSPVTDNLKYHTCSEAHEHT
jgi:hypothetical protein